MANIDNLYNIKGKRRPYSNDTQAIESTIRESGNSDVDISILVDTKPIAYAMLCSLLATKQLTRREFEKAVRELEELTHNFNRNDVSNVRLYEDK
ncbi:MULTISPECIES: hypothetical protein [Oceanobacillus]|uniref:Uncharacterized protein n=1 Tax=Oceanobacillus kimchii TaxID=746691 RepID=A0ABQ5TFY3_9BACI|nr:MULTISPECIES: hypothetical protein [Oceanobacillus]MCT1577775.1 hypothetical protein [Oceanobacillus kimchii]MCT2136763.1 hypothetical protein [Oceanobacillus kimchii]GLO64499.1 hypothetical protein MACH08_02830 [Oceanobacillus kimchii]